MREREKIAKAIKTGAMGEVVEGYQPNAMTEHGSQGHYVAKVSDAFLKDLSDDWEKNGQAVLNQVRLEDPSTYLRVLATLVPKEKVLRAGGSLATFLDQLEAYAERKSTEEAVRMEDESITIRAGSIESKPLALAGPPPRGRGRPRKQPDLGKIRARSRKINGAGVVVPVVHSDPEAS
jgi:hypothetical protein